MFIVEDTCSDTLTDAVCFYSEYYGYMERGFGRGGRRGRSGGMMVRNALELSENITLQ